jgi:RNA polymerase sigma factor (TIGR02999 family)
VNPHPPRSEGVPPADPSPSDALTQRFYDELRGIAERIFAAERDGHTLQPTAVVNEACVRLLTSSKLPDLPREERLALAGRVLQQVLIDHARSRHAQKRGGGAVQIELDDQTPSRADTVVDVDRLHRALERLRTLSPRQAEVVTMRVFSGLSMEQVAGLLEVSKRTAEDDWTVARAWLRRELAKSYGAGGA